MAGFTSYGSRQERRETMRKSGVSAFFLGFIPGMGHLYLNKIIRGILYPMSIVLLLISTFSIAVDANDGFPFFVGVMISIMIWIVSMVDLKVTFNNYAQMSHAGTMDEALPHEGFNFPNDQNSTKTILLSFIPGLGHMHLGLMYRGLTFIIGFFGILTMIFFVSVFTGEEGFLVFLGAMPIIWIYSLFDAIQLLHRRNRGEVLVDRSILEELEEHREQGRKSKMIATFLAIFPGAGHMYLGLQKRGLQLMAAFLFSIYILDVLHLSLFLFVIPLIYDYFPQFRNRYLYERYFQTTIVSVLLIVGGLVLLAGSRKSKGKGGGNK